MNVFVCLVLPVLGVFLNLLVKLFREPVLSRAQVVVAVLIGREVLRVNYPVLRVEDLLSTEDDEHSARDEANKPIGCVSHWVGRVRRFDCLNKLFDGDERGHRDHILAHELLNLQIAQL